MKDSLLVIRDYGVELAKDSPDEAKLKGMKDSQETAVKAVTSTCGSN